MKKGIDYIGVGVGAILKNTEGKYFLSKRGIKAHNEVGTWEFPGGGVEFGNTLEETIIKEIEEEFGIQIKVDSHLKTADHMIPSEKQHWIGVTFLCTLLSGVPEIKEPEKCSQIGWFSIDEIQDMNLSIISQNNFEILKNL